ncbi:MAG: 2-hydroxychromene-2-carboxylate isomerase [Gammaproteobacteria bacterium]|nr:2-hydroxychromene-2-carboxylate isomerase [Gammaproteobacteria bacterium]NKB64631.1 2-hydroxychromene-2-carboxylate isomerase [Gammaproteobacteria bacterium]
MKVVHKGFTHRQVFHPGPEHLASALGNHGVDVVSTIHVILYFEETAHSLVLPFFEADEVSVGTHVNVDHLAPAWGNKPVTVSATLVRQQGRRLEFELEAYQEESLIMQGQHHRAVMKRSDLNQTVKKGKVRSGESGSVEQPKIQGIDFWFDFHSPWCYFAANQIGEIAHQFELKVNWKPVHLANLSQAVDGRKPLEANSRFVSWYQQDQYDTAGLMGLPFCPHTEYPKRPSRALRAAIFASECDLAEPFVRAVMAGYWSEQKDISDLEWLANQAKKVGLNPEKTISAAVDPRYKQLLNDNLQLAVKANLFGLPSVVVGGKIFWGNDRMFLLRHYLSTMNTG